MLSIWLPRAGSTRNSAIGSTLDFAISTMIENGRSMNVLSINRKSSAGKIRNQEVRRPSDRIAEDGEILVKSEMMFSGYYKEPEKTAEMFDDAGWLKTGDLGELDEDGDFAIGNKNAEAEASEPGALQKIVGGKLVSLKPGESLDSFQPNRPRMSFSIKNLPRRNSGSAKASKRAGPATRDAYAP